MSNSKTSNALYEATRDMLAAASYARFEAPELEREIMRVRDRIVRLIGRRLNELEAKELLERRNEERCSITRRNAARWYPKKGGSDGAEHKNQR